MITELQERILQEARSWIGTPWRDGGSIAKGAGVDCSRFALLVFQACGLCPPIEIEVVNPKYCHNRRNPSLILRWLSDHPELAQPVPGGIRDAQPCDLLCCIEGRVVHHIAILDADRHHAIGAIARYGVQRYLVIGDPRIEATVKAVYRHVALNV